ncbi:hypothetical protein [Streptomyces canus]|uniref:hypothetical protein n=1 Tax=Streptomyces canus TaxID=58343 RepID=UPI002E33ECE6|nr:hypothetical protein [Streptomyces canus]
MSTQTDHGHGLISRPELTPDAVWYEAAGWINQSFFQGRTSLNEKKLRSRYLEITQRRNKIAHDADLIDGELEQRRPIDQASVSDAIDWIERIALAVAQVLDDQG